MREIGFLLTPDFPVVSLSTAVEPLRAANEITGLDLYRWRVLAAEAKPIASSSRLTITPDAGLEGINEVDLLFVIGGTSLADQPHDDLQAALRRADRHGVRIGGISGGVFLLARAGLMDGRKCAVHWYLRNAFREQFPAVFISNKLFEIESDRLTCAGGTAALDMMLKLMSPNLSGDVAHEISIWFQHTHVRDAWDEQGAVEIGPAAATSPRLTQAISVFRRNVETPLSLAEVAAEVGVGTRQMQRLFRRHLGVSPGDYYRQVRLRQARELVNHTAMPLSEIAIATGFLSYSHFLRCYKQQFGGRPRRGVGQAKDSRTAGAVIE